ncbi:MAG TPA: hypothetical protein VIL74_24605 [Pyrinomonadaceae bacterium]
MNIFSFSVYYIKVLLGVASGSKKTVNPISPRWRWRQWKHREKTGRYARYFKLSK